MNLAHTLYAQAVLAIDENTGQNIADALVAWLKPAVFVVTLALAIFFAVQKQFSKVWGVIFIGAVIFALSLGTGESSIIGKFAQFIVSLIG